MQSRLKIRLKVSLTLFLMCFAFGVSAQNFTAEEQDFQRSCKNGIASACEELSASVRNRVENGQTVNIDAGEMLIDECAAGIRSVAPSGINR